MSLTVFSKHESHHRRRRWHWLAWTGAVACMLAFGASPLAAQTSTGSIRGYVRDGRDSAIANAQVIARSADMGISRGGLTNAAGFYSIVGLRPGTWLLEARRIGLSPQTRTVIVAIGQTVDANFTMTASTTQLATVQVTAAPIVESRTSEVATNVSAAQIEQLPSPSRNFLDLAVLAPGVRVTEDRINGSSKTFAAGAQPAEQVNVFVDGASYKNDIVQGGIAGQDASRGNPFPRNAVQEFRVATSNFKAEYQKASSAIITAVTKSGTNDWQGSAFANYQNESYVALDTFDLHRKFACDSLAALGKGPTNGQPCFKKPDYSRKMLGLSAGGPIARDKLFIFGSYEGNYQVRQGRTLLGGTPAGLPSTVTAINNTAHNQPFNSNLIFGKLTYNQSQKSLIEFSTDARLESEQRDFGGNVAYSSGDYFYSDVVTSRLKHTYYGGRGTNEALASYQWYKWNNEPFDFTTPVQDYGVGIIGGHDSRQNLVQRRLSFRDDYTVATLHAAGVHVPKIGANLDFDRYDLKKQLNENPRYFWNTNNNFAFPVQASIGIGNPTIATNNTQLGLYAQDDWSPTERLTVNLGLRWDYESNMYNRNFVTPQNVIDTVTANLNRFFVPIDPNRYFTNGSQRKPFYGAIQPRVGASYALDRDARTTVFGGWGIYYDRLPFNFTIDEAYRRQHPNYNFFFSQNGGGNTLAWNPQYATRQGLLNAIASGQAPPQEVFLLPNDLKPPHSNQWSLGVRHDFGAWNSSITYADTRSFNGLSYEWANVTYRAGIDCCQVVNGLPYQNILVGNNDVRTWYNSVQLQLDRPYHLSTRRWGWGAGVAWTVAKAQAEGGDLFSFPQVAKNPRHPISADQRNHVVGNWITDMPYLWGIQFTGLLELGSGTPFDVTYFDPTVGATIRTGTARPKQYSFIIPHAWAYRRVDIGFRKDFANVGGNHMGVTADVFNLFNYNNFTNFVNTRYNVVNNTLVPNPNFGFPTDVVSDPRRLQIGVVYDFGPRLGGR
jgi:outer membrane receptor protein involved in Fe transport